MKKNKPAKNELDQLREEWYLKLRATGFKDSETEFFNDSVKFHDYYGEDRVERHKQRNLKDRYQEVIKEQFENNKIKIYIDQNKDNLAFIEYEILYYISENYSYRNIPALLPLRHIAKTGKDVVYSYGYISRVFNDHKDNIESFYDKYQKSEDYNE